MSIPQAELQAVRDFVAGTSTPDEFHDLLTRLPSFPTWLDDAAELPSPSYIKSNTYAFLTALNWRSPGDHLSAQGALTQFLDRRGITYTRTERYSALYELLLDAQPKWLDAPSLFLESLLADSPPDLTSRTRKVKWLRERLLGLFRYASKPPRWIQNPDWPIRDGVPLVFLAQATVSDYFHDEAAAYVFFDPATRKAETILQVY